MINLLCWAAACTGSNAPATPIVSNAVEGDEELSTAAIATLAASATPLPELLPDMVFSAESDLCYPEIEGSPFVLTCSQNSLQVVQSDTRRKVDSLLFRHYPIEADAFSLEAETTSQSAEGVRTDQNAYGFYWLDEEGKVFALRVQGQYFNFEQWDLGVEVKINSTLSPAYSPFIHPAGNQNHWRLDCSPSACDVWVNEQLIGRSRSSAASPIKGLGIFTASAWDELFGSVTYTRLKAQEFMQAASNQTAYLLEDDLKQESDLFVHSGMSGAFHAFAEDGFHFSPVIPFGYYGLKTGPALENMDVRATVTMEIDSQKRGTQYAGLICRSSQAGMYMAVLRVDGSYIIFRDTPDRPFSLLAKRNSDVIRTGLTENALRLVCSGDALDFYINDQLVESLQDTRYKLNFGRGGIYTKAGGEAEPDAIIFSDFSIREVK